MANGGNFCTLNPNNNMLSGDSGSDKVIIANGNLSTEDQGSYYSNVVGTHAVSGTGKFYYEYRAVTAANNGNRFGWLDLNQAQNVATAAGTPGYPGSIAASWTANNNASQSKIQFSNNNSSSAREYTGAQSAGDVWCMGLDLSTGKWYISKNVALDPSSAATSTVSSGTLEVFSNLDGGLYAPSGGEQGGSDSFYIFGQDSTFGGARSAGGETDANDFGDFAFAVPSDYLAICSGTISVSSDIDPAGNDGATENPDKQAGAVIYTGNGGSPDLAVTGLGFQPDLVWGKARGASQLPILQDSARGQELLFSSSANAAQTSNGPFMASFDSDGFTYDGSGSNPNDNAVTYVAWCFRANGGTATATITESGNNPGAVVQANPKGGFSIITYTGTGGAGTIAHGLDSAPTFMIMKNRGVADPWAVYHIGTDASPATKYLVLNTNAAAADDATYWNDTAPTSSLLTVGTNHSVNADGETYVAYVWAPVKGGSKFGKFEGNADDSGTFIYTGFRPKIIFIKKTDGADDWVVYDTARNTFNPSQKIVRWENAAAELDNASRAIDIYSNGFKLRTSNTTINSATTYVYGAWGDVPFKYNNTF